MLGRTIPLGRKNKRFCNKRDDTLDTIEKLLRTLLKKVNRMSVELDRLTASVGEVTTKADSLIALVEGLAQIIRDNASNPTALNKLADDLDAQSGELQAAIDRNTPPAV